MVAEVADPVDNAYHGARKLVARSGMADNLATDTVFLGSKGESDERDASQVGDITGERVKAIVSNEQLDVAEAIRVALSRTAILAGTKGPKESHVAQVGYR